MDILQGGEWALAVITAVNIIACVCIVLSVQGDLRDVRFGRTTNDEAVAMFIYLLARAKRSVDIHDDGNDFDESVYNDPRVVDAIGDCLKRNVKIRCLFNNQDRTPRILSLLKPKDKNDCMQVWYLNSERPDSGTPYKIVDDGRYLHLSNHAHGDDEREYSLQKAPRFWEYYTRKRISRRFSEHFENGLKISTQAFG